MKTIPRTGILLLLFLLIMSGQSSVNADNSATILKSLQERFENLIDMEISFRQEVNSGVFSSVERTSGKMYLAKGDKFLIQTEDQTISSDGKLLWVYSKENKQVTIDKVSNARDLVRPSDYLFSFRESYSPSLLPDTTLGKIACRVVELVCNEKDEFIQKMTLFIGGDDRLTRRAVYVDINGNVVTIDFSDLKVDNGLPENMFEFKTPKGVEEIRLP
ncbi:MAG: outer membrane lipoprotein carrier protein LolA [Candidatus Zixiibacteriota bacterium]